MATNAQGTRSTNRTVDTTVVDGTPSVTTTGVGSVAVYDHDADTTVDTTRRTTMASDPMPVETRSTGSVMSWIIGAIVLILIAYFILQVIF